MEVHEPNLKHRRLKGPSRARPLRQPVAQALRVSISSGARQRKRKRTGKRGASAPANWVVSVCLQCLASKTRRHEVMRKSIEFCWRIVHRF